MKRISTLLILSLLVIFQINAQILKEDEIIGTWSVLKVQFFNDNISNDKKQMVEMVKESFLKSKFIFKIDHNFDFDFSFDDMKIKNAHWKLNPTTNTLLIQNWEDKEKSNIAIMVIQIKKIGDKIIFEPSETMLSLEMRKESPNR